MAAPTQDQVIAFGRHIITFGGGAVTMFAALHLITAGDAQSAASALNKIGNGFAEVVTGLGTLVAIASGVYASLSANPLLQFLKGAKAVAADPGIAKSAPVADSDQAAVAKAATELPKVHAVLAAPEVANAVPGAAVQSSDEARVVSK